MLIALLTTGITINSYSQLSKAEKKEWKKKAKQYAKNPEALKQVDENNKNLNSEVSSLRTEVKNLQSKVSDKDATIADLQSDLQKLRSELASTRSQLAKATAEPKEPAKLSSGGKMVDGVVFKVQIGAFKNKDLAKYFDNHENFGGEVDEDGTQKFTIGQFRDYWEADTFKKYLREMGVKDAWIVPYKDGVRVDIKDVLEGVTQGGS